MLPDPIGKAGSISMCQEHVSLLRKAQGEQSPVCAARCLSDVTLRMPPCLSASFATLVLGALRNRTCCNLVGAAPPFLFFHQGSVRISTCVVRSVLLRLYHREVGPALHSLLVQMCHGTVNWKRLAVP